MTDVGVEVEAKILVLSFEEKFDVDGKKRNRPSWTEFAKADIASEISETLRRSIRRRNLYYLSRTPKGGEYQNNYAKLRSYISRPEIFEIDFEEIEGSIIWKDGEIRITNRTLGILLFLFFGTTNFFSNYEAAKSGVAAILTDIQYGYEAAIREINLNLIVEDKNVDGGRIPSKIPPSHQVAKDFLHAIREEDLKRTFERVGHKRNKWVGKHGS